MPVNEEYVEARIREINDAIKMLKETTSKNYSELTEHEKLAIRYLVIQLVEAASSVCLHLLLNLFNEKPEGFPECFLRLSAKGLIPKDLATKLSSAARLRNLIVHRYWTIRDEIVYESVKGGLRDFEEFTLEARSLMESVQNE